MSRKQKKDKKETREPAIKAEEWAKQSPQGISWATVIAILSSIATLAGFIVNGLDFINYLREGYQNFLWLGLIVLGIIWLIVLWLLFKQRNVYGILWFAVTVVGAVVVGNAWQSYHQIRENKLIVLIAQFDGPEEVYGLRNEILERLNEDFSNNTEVAIESVNEIITPDSTSGSLRAVELGKSFQADIVIWGWYRPTQNPNITIHTENLSPSQVLMSTDDAFSKPVTSLAALESFSFQQKAGQETSALVSFLAGFLKFVEGDFDSAIDYFEMTLVNETDVQLFSENQVLVYAFLADAYAFLQKHHLALQYYDRLIEIGPPFTDLYNNRGSAYSALGEYGKAMQDFDQAIKIDPRNGLGYYNRGVIYDYLGEFELAIKEYDLAIQFDPQYRLSYLNRGLAYSMLEDQQRAIQDYDQVIRLFPDFAEAYGNRGFIYYQLNDFPRAIEDFDMAVKIDPKQPVSLNGRGLANYALQNYDEAVQDFSHAIEISPEFIQPYFNRGRAHGAIKNYELAIQDFDKVIYLDQYFSDVYYQRGFVYFLLGNFQRAIQDFDQEIENNPEAVESIYFRGVAYLNLGEYQRSIQDFNQVLSIDPNHAFTYYSRGHAYQKLGHTAEAEADFKKYEELTGEKLP